MAVKVSLWPNPRALTKNQLFFSNGNNIDGKDPVHPKILEQARLTGELNLFNRGLTTVPESILGKMGG